MITSPSAMPDEPSPQPSGPEIQPQPPRPEELPPQPPGPDIFPGPATPEEIPQPSEPDVGPSPPDQIPAPQPDLVPTPPGNTPTMALRLTFAAALLWACGGLDLHDARAQTDQALPSAPPEVMEDAPAKTPGAGSLSEELSRSEGVIAPPEPGIDPGIVQPAPDTGGPTMPVIPPPGTSGGDPKVRPQ